jgi:acetyl esterase
MPIDPQTRALMDNMEKMGFGDPTAQPVATTRAAQAALRPDPAPARAPLARVEDRRIPGPAGTIPVRIYTPKVAPGRPLPVLVYFHGGGWVLGDLDGFDGLCCALTQRAECVTVSVDYRLAPEHPYPAAVEDCDAALAWVAANAAALGGDPARLVVGGDSAGGNLAAVCARHARDRGGPSIALQLLIYPVTLQAAPPSASRLRLADGYFLTHALMEWFTALYIPDAARRAEADASPLLAADLAGLPPAFVLTVEFDPLVDEGETYAQRLVAAGVPVRSRRYLGTIHGFLMFNGILDTATQAVADIAGAIRAL